MHFPLTVLDDPDSACDLGSLLCHRKAMHRAMRTAAFSFAIASLASSIARAGSIEGLLGQCGYWPAPRTCLNRWRIQVGDLSFPIVWSSHRLAPGCVSH